MTHRRGIPKMKDRASNCYDPRNLDRIQWRATLTAHNLHVFATSKPAAPAARRFADRFIVRRRGLNRSVEHEKYGQPNDTVSEVHSNSPTSKMLKPCPKPCETINAVFLFHRFQQRKRIRFDYHCEFRCVSFWCLRF